MRRLLGIVTLGVLVSAGLIAQSSVVGPVDPLRFSQLKDFTAARSSSNNPDRTRTTTASGRSRARP